LTIVRKFEIPGLATVSLDTRDNSNPLLEIQLSPEYSGDLNDIALHTDGDDDIYLRCDQVKAVNSPELAKFVEVMSHYDFTGDGLPDCDEIIDAIEEAFWQSKEKPDVFHRPNGGWYTRAVMSIMPPAPVRHIVFSFGELRPRFRLHHFAYGIAMLSVFIGLVLLQDHFFPFMKYSPLSGGAAAIEAVGLPKWTTIPIIVIVVFILTKRSRPSNKPSISRHTYGFFNGAAVFEEQAFREGAESWSFWQRFRSCVAFGAIHMVNLFYPLATILPLAVGGALLTVIYLRNYRRTGFRRAAVLEAAVWHRVYNKIALTVAAVALVITIGYMLAGLFAALFGLAIFFGFVRQRSIARRIAPLDAESSSEAAQSVA
jgi:hypothetical protein